MTGNTRGWKVFPTRKKDRKGYCSKDYRSPGGPGKGRKLFPPTASRRNVAFDYILVRLIFKKNI